MDAHSDQPEYVETIVIGGGQAGPLGALLEPAGEEGLARAVLAADRLEAGAAPGDGPQLGVDCTPMNLPARVR